MKQTYLNFTNTIEIHTKTTTVNAAGQKKASFSLNSTIKCSAQSGAGTRRMSGYMTEVDSYLLLFSHEDVALTIYANRFKNLKDRDGTVIEAGPFEATDIEKKLGVSGKVNHVRVNVTKVIEGSEND